MKPGPFKKLLIVGGGTLIGSTTETQVTCADWRNLKAVKNMRDYDAIVFNCATWNPKESLDISSVSSVFSVSTFAEFLASGGVAVFLGDPRFDVFAWGRRTFLYWTGLEVTWDSQPGDTRVLGKDAGVYQRYLADLSQWKYSLATATVSKVLRDEVTTRLGVTGEDIRLRFRQQPLCRTRYDRWLAFAIQAIIQERRIQIGGEGWFDVVELGEVTFLPETDLAATDALETVLKDRFGVTVKESEPEWAKPIVAIGQEAVDDRIATLETTIADAQMALEMERATRMNVREPIRLLYDSGHSLEQIVRNILGSLGAQVEDPTDPGKEDGWITVTIGDQTLEGVLEVKSTSNGQFSQEGPRQLLDWINRGIELRGKLFKGIFVGNGSFGTPVEERPDPFSDEFRKAAALRKIVCLTTTHLYQAYDMDRRGKLDRAVFWKVIFGTNGILEPQVFETASRDTAKAQKNVAPAAQD